MSEQPNQLSLADELLQLAQQEALLNARKASLERRLKASMQEAGITKLESKAGKIQFKLKRGRKPIGARTSERLLALQSELALEQDEMRSANLKTIYELEKQAFLAQQKIRLLSTNEWCSQLASQIEEERARLDKEEAKTLESDSYSFSIELADKDWLSEMSPESQAMVEADRLEMTNKHGKRFQRKWANDLAKSYLLGALGDETFEQAWKAMVADFDTYWSKRSNA